MSDIVPSWCKLGYYIDAKDSMNDWCVAQVKDISKNDKTVTVFHDGWGIKTTTYPLKSSKIAPFRKNTIKYTGPKRCAIRGWEFSEYELAEAQNQVDALIASNLDHSDPFYITQFLRGSLYILIENLLTCSSSSFKQQLPAVVVFFGSTVKLIVLWLKKAPDLFPYYYKSLSQPDLYLEDKNVALSLVWHELMDTLNKLFALDSRVSSFFQTYDEVPADYEPTPLTIMKDQKYSETLMYIINLFTKEQGFEMVIAILHEKEELKRVPFPFIATTLLYVLGQFFNQEFWDKFNKDLTSAVYQRIDIISELELKDIKHEDILRVLGMIKDNNENLDEKKFNFFLRMIKSNYFEKRIKGLGEINIVIEGVEKKLESSKGRISREELKELIIRSNLLELVTNDRPNVELIKRSSTIFKFLAQCKAIETSHIESLWHSLQGKHDSFIRATYSAIIEFSPYLSSELQDFLYTKIKSVPVSEYDESYLSLVKDFTANAINLAARYAIQNRKDNTKVYGLEILDSLMLDSSPVDFSKLSCKYIGSILAAPLVSKIRGNYLKKLLEFIKNGESVPQSMKLLIKLIKGMRETKRQGVEIKALNGEFDIFGLVIHNFKGYIAKSREEGQEIDNMNRVLVGRFPHHENLKIRLRFIEFIMHFSNGNVSLTDEHIQGLWELLGSSPVEAERRMLLNWLTEGIKHIPLLESENTEFFFKSILMSPLEFPVTGMSEEAFACFKMIFLSHHYNEENIELVNSKFKFRKSANLEGFDKLVQIQLNSEKVSEDAAKLIVSLLLRYSTQHYSIAAEIQDNFTDFLLTFILEKKDDDGIVTRGLLLLKRLLTDTESEEFTPNTYVYVHEVYNRDFCKIHYDQNRNLRHLRKEIAKNYRRPLESITLQVTDQKYSSVDDDLDLRHIKAHCIGVEFKHPDHREHNPLPGLSQNQKVIKSLFELLSNTEKSYTNVAWSLLVSLPTNQQLEDTFESLDQPIEELLDLTSIHKLLYKLIIIRKLSNDDRWLQKFVQHKGLEHLLNIFYNNQLNTAMLQDSLIRTLSKFFIYRNIKAFNLIKLTETLFHSLVKIVNSPDEMKDCKNFTKAIEEAFEFLTDNNPEVIKEFIIVNPAVLTEIFDRILLEGAKPELSVSMRVQLEKIAESPEIINSYFKVLYSMLEKSLKSANENYWELLAYIVKHCKSHDEEKKSVVKMLVRFIKTSACERSGKDKNPTLYGALTVLSRCWIPSIKVKLSHVKLFLHKCLFEIPELLDRNTLSPPICKNLESRSCAFDLLLELSAISAEFLEATVKELDKFHEDPSWRGFRRADWGISAVSNEKSQSGLVGIKNLGSTCYMNSLLQQLFMLKSFRDGILSTKTDPESDNLLYQLQYLFASLAYSDKQYINPKSFTGTIKDFDGNPINVLEQMDVDEFFNYFMDKLESSLKSTQSQSLISSHFGGLQVTELIGKDCIHRSERLEPFLTVSVEVKNKKSLLEGLESFVSGEILEGENAYQCDHCEAKVKAIRRVCIKHLPNILIIALRRFEFDFDSMTRVKLNDFCEFPLEIDMEPYTQEGLDRHEKIKEKSKDHPIPPKKFSDDYYTYKLRGVVIHAGTAESGHYYSYIQDHLRGWFEFNDIWVKEFNPADIPDECFGGEEKFSWSSAITNSQNTGIREKCGNAYLLFYERSGIYQSRHNDEESLEPTSLQVEIPGELEHIQSIKKQNQKYWRNKHIFASEYSKFISGMCRLQIVPFKFIFKFLVTIMLRTKEKREEIIHVYLRLEKEIEGCIEKAKWVLEVVSEENVCKELLLLCPMIFMRKIVVGLAKTAMKRVGGEECARVALRVIQVLPYARKKFSKNFTQYLEILAASIMIGKDYLGIESILKIVTDYLVGENVEVPDKPEDIYEDIHLGYTEKLETEVEKTDLFYVDSKSISYAHIFQLLLNLLPILPQNCKTVLKTADTIDSLLKWVDNKLSIRYFGKLYGKLMSDSTESYRLYMKKLFDLNQAPDLNRRTQGSKLFTHFLTIKCPLQQEIISCYIASKLKLLKGIRAIPEIESNIAYILNLCSRSKEFQELLKEHKDLLVWMEKWLKDNMHYTFINSKSAQFDDSVRPSLKALHQKCQKLLKNEDLYKEDYWDSDDEIAEEELQRERILDVSESNSHWVKGIIKERIGELLYVKIKSWNDSEYYTLKETYGEEIAPLGYYTSRSN